MKSNPTLRMLLRVAQYLCALALALAASLFAQGFSTTTVQGTVYLANGKPASGTVQITWPAFTTAAGQAVTAGRTSLKLGSDGFLSVALAPNQGATPAGLYYTVVYNLSDGSTATEYWTVPAAAQAAIAQVRAQVMPAAQAVQAVSKSYVDQAIQQIAASQMSSSGGSLTGPLYLNGDPLIPSQAANKHYVDSQFAQALPRSGGIAAGPLTGTQLGAAYQVDQFQGADFGAQLQACINRLSGTNGGTCDARNFPGTLTMANKVNVATANITIYLPCATITTAASFVVAPGTRNVTLHGCASRGTSAASGSQGGTVFAYSGSGLFFQIGDPAYVIDTLGFHLDNVAVNTTTASSPTAQALGAYRAQEMHLESLYLLGDANQTGITLDGTGNYTGGTFTGLEFVGFQTAIHAIGHQIANAASTDWLNASTFVRLHIDCPTSNGNPIAGTIGIDLTQGDGNTITGGDIEGCATALHLGPNAQNNTIVGLRNEKSTSQVVADLGSSYNNWISGGTMFTGQLTDNGTRNSFMDTFHRSFNGLNGDWFGTQQDATLTNHYRLGIGAGNERGLLNRYQTDYGYRWTTGLSDAAGGAQFYQVQDELNNVYRLSIGQYNPGQPSTNNQTVLNSAGTGAIVLNGSANAGTGGVVFGSGGASSTTVATVDKQGNANFTGTLQVGKTAQSTGTFTVRNNADAEVDYYLWPGLTTNQKGSFTYKDYAGNSQWYMVKDASNNWALNSAIGGLDSIKAYQSNNSGDTYLNASNSSGAVRINYETGAGSAFHIYGGGSSNLYASFTGANSIKFPGLAAGSGRNCLQIDNSGYLSNTGQPCGTGSGSGTVNSGNAGQIAYYTANGTSLGGTTAVPLANGGTGASNAASALANLGALPAAGGTMTGSLSGTNASFSGTITSAQAAVSNINGVPWVTGGPVDLGAAISQQIAAMGAGGNPVQINLAPGQNYVATSAVANAGIGVFVDCHGSTIDVSALTGPFLTWNNPGWSNLGGQFVHPPTGIVNCKFTGPQTNGNGVYIGYVGAISDFIAENDVMWYGGAFVVDGPSANDHFYNVNTYHPLNQQVWLQKFSSAFNQIPGAFAPGKVLYDHCYVEEAPATLAVTAFEMQAGDPIIRDTHTEAVAIGVHVNGSGANGASVTVEGGTIEFRAYTNLGGIASQGVVVDAAGTLAHTKINGTQFIFGDSLAQTDVAIVNNWNGGGNNSYIDVTGISTIVGGQPASTAEMFRVTAGPLHLHFTGNKVRPIMLYANLNVFDIQNGASIDQSNISTNTMDMNYGTQTVANFISPTSNGAISNTTISGNLFSRVGNFTNLGVGTGFTGNVSLKPASGVAVVFTGAGKFADNWFDSTPTVTLASGTDCHGNTNYTSTACVQQVVQPMTLSFPNGSQSTAVPFYWKPGASMTTSRTYGEDIATGKVYWHDYFSPSGQWLYAYDPAGNGGGTNVWGVDPANGPLFPLLSQSPYAICNNTAGGFLTNSNTSCKVGNADTSTNIVGGTLGAIPYQSGLNGTVFLAPNTSTTKCFLQETGTGTAGQAPGCSALQSADIPNNSASTTGTASNVTGIVAPANGGTGTNNSSATGFGVWASGTFSTRQIVQSDLPASGAILAGATTGLGTGNNATGISVSIPANATQTLKCVVLYRQMTAASTVQWGLNLSAAPGAGGVTVYNKDDTGAYIAGKYATLAGAGTTLVSNADALSDFGNSTGHKDEMDIVFHNGSSANTMLITAQSGNGSDTITILPDSFCKVLQ